MSNSQALIGIDWGTHSSKWTWTWLEGGSGRIVEGPFKILRSEVCLEDGGQRILISDDPPRRGSIYASGVKGKLIKNPEAPFWSGRQKRIRLTLGELVTFSLWTLLGEAYDNLCRTVSQRPDALDIRLSLPNWVDTAEGAVGRACYEQAARVACHLFMGGRERWSQSPHPTREQWRHEVDETLRALNISDECEIDTSPDGFHSMIDNLYNAGGGVQFRFVAESSAAGLAGLRRVAEIDEGHLVKILIVDVGAGSTDIGYVLRSRSRVESGPKEVLCQLPPANTCKIAGEDLSRRIVEIYRSRGEDIGLDGAEAIKVGGEEISWQAHPAVGDWIRGIGEHVGAYAWGIRDQRFLPDVPGLKVLVTGGSGIVPGLREGVLAAVVDALRGRGVRADVISATTPMTLALGGPAARDANRLAVALGAASEELPRLSYHESLGPRVSSRPRVMRPPWTGWGR